uniref:Peptidase C1A papain C-terminal domain-containing protein n=1 Tax=Glycine max TaxID=3847 RepID=K7KXU4_SOYBN
MVAKNHFYHIAFAMLLSMAFLAFQVTCRTLQDASMYESHGQRMTRYSKENVNYIEACNNAADKPYKRDINQFAPKKRFKGHMCSSIIRITTFKFENVTATPSTVDCRQKVAVTPIKDQGQCAGKLILLSSEQELVDCDTKGVDQDCQGGLMDDAFKFIIQNHGLNTEANYPYIRQTRMLLLLITGHILQKAVANNPVSVAIDASGSDFQFYKSGVFTGSCGTELDHGVTAVGYGVSDDGTEYWLVKNSRGTEWGEEGYIRMQRGVDSEEALCGIAVQASYPSA